MEQERLTFVQISTIKIEYKNLVNLLGYYIFKNDYNHCLEIINLPHHMVNALKMKPLYFVLQYYLFGRKSFRDYEGQNLDIPDDERPIMTRKLFKLLLEKLYEIFLIVRQPEMGSFFNFFCQPIIMNNLKYPSHIKALIEFIGANNMNAIWTLVFCRKVVINCIISIDVYLRSISDLFKEREPNINNLNEEIIMHELSGDRGIKYNILIRLIISTFFLCSKMKEFHQERLFNFNQIINAIGIFNKIENFYATLIYPKIIEREEKLSLLYQFPPQSGTQHFSLDELIQQHKRHINELEPSLFDIEPSFRLSDRLRPLNKGGMKRKSKKKSYMKR